MKKIFQLAIMACTALSVHATDYTRGFSIWFDTPQHVSQQSRLVRQYPSYVERRKQTGIGR